MVQPKFFTKMEFTEENDDEKILRVTSSDLQKSTMSLESLSNDKN